MKEKRHALKQKAGPPQAPEPLTIDYPQEGDILDGYAYTFRVTAPLDACPVEVSLDRGPWLACRFAAGHWWYDWSGFSAGRYQLRARMRTADGRLKMTLLRRFSVP
ncbi:MAG: hypothetical protein PHF00_06695 [Elusimicrobia bacterium]|nr:hypothetical protein [Elusimicrobiota bacterium]